jgi:hypothetical protein
MHDGVKVCEYQVLLYSHGYRYLELVQRLFTLPRTGLPILFVALWVVGRVEFEDYMCWTTHKNPYVLLLLRLPVIISVLVSCKIMPLLM